RALEAGRMPSLHALAAKLPIKITMSTSLLQMSPTLEQRQDVLTYCVGFFPLWRVTCLADHVQFMLRQFPHPDPHEGWRCNQVGPTRHDPQRTLQALQLVIPIWCDQRWRGGTFLMEGMIVKSHPKHYAFRITRPITRSELPIGCILLADLGNFDPRHGGIDFRFGKLPCRRQQKQMRNPLRMRMGIVDGNKRASCHAHKSEGFEIHG